MSFDLPEPEVAQAPPEVFSQSVEPDAAPPEPEAQAAPEPTPEPEPELPAVEPDWIDSQPEPTGPHPGQYPPEPPQNLPAAPPMYPPQPAPQYAQPAPTGADAALQAFVDNPEQWVRQIQQETLQQAAGQLGWQQQQLAGEVNQMRQTYAESNIGQAKSTIKQAYDHLNKNPTFRSNKAMQDSIKTTLQGYYDQASAAARSGNYGPISEFAQIGPAQLDGMMAYLSAVGGIQSPGVGPLQVEGATVESSRSAVDDGSVVLTPLQEDIAKKMGPGYRDRMIKAEVENRKYDDFEVNG